MLWIKFQSYYSLISNFLFWKLFACSLNFNPIIVLFLTRWLYINKNANIEDFNPIIVLFLTFYLTSQEVSKLLFQSYYSLISNGDPDSTPRYTNRFQSYYSLISNSGEWDLPKLELVYFNPIIVLFLTNSSDDTGSGDTRFQSYYSLISNLSENCSNVGC